MLLSEQYNELAFYTLSHPDSVSFIHQHIVDAQTAQTADAETKPISIVFALVGLYLTVEKNYTGRQVQQVHMKLAKNKKQFSPITLPKSRGCVTIAEVLDAPGGNERDKIIRNWCASVWEAYSNMRETVISYYNAATR